MPVSRPSYVERCGECGRSASDGIHDPICTGTDGHYYEPVRFVPEAEVERLREANIALRQALVRIEDHARRVGDDALAGVALIARDAINAS